MEAAMKRLFTRFGSLDDHLKELLRGATTAASLKIVAALATFGLHLMLGRMLGPEGTGIYFLAFTIVTIVAVLARFGLDNALVRFIAAGEAAGQPERVRGVYRLGVWITATASCVLGGLLCAMAPWFATSVFKDTALAMPLQIMALAVPPFALFVIHAQALQGLKRIRDAIATLSVIAPVLTAMLSIVLIPQFGVSGATGAYAVAAMLTLAFGIWRWRHWTCRYEDNAPRFSIGELLHTSIPLFWIAVMNIIITWVSTLMLGVFASSYEVGLFSAANRTAMLVGFFLLAVNSIAAPKFAALYQENDIQQLRRVANLTNILISVLALPVLLMFAVMPTAIMEVFGKGFEGGAHLLVILSVGQFINVVTGSVGYLLMMTGSEQSMRNSLLMASVMCLILNAVLIPIYKETGAAIATCITVSLQNVTMWIQVRRVVFRDH